MEISKVTFRNFKQYYGQIEVNFNVSYNQNVIVIGGKNGHGKTNFLIGLVWCLYGSNISSVDEIFKQQVKGGYSRFLTKALNWTAKQEGLTSFLVEISFNNVELSEGLHLSSNSGTQVTVRREYDTINGDENLSIFIEGKELELMKDDDEKTSFINDYIVPIQAAKFVFFDAEKIADIAELNLSEQGRIMNEALGKLLGLDVYENLVGDLEIARKNLKKESATQEIYDQIDSFENKRKINLDKITLLLQDIDSIDDQYYSNQRQISDIEKYLSEHGIIIGEVDLTALLEQKRNLEEQKIDISTVFYDHLEIIPFCISAGKMQELVTQLHNEDQIKISQYENETFIEKSALLIENLFNKEPFPSEDISLKQKFFYLNKADSLFKQIFLDVSSNEDVLFEHDLSKADTQFIYSLYDSLKSSNDEKFESFYKELVRIENDLTKVNNDIRKAEGEMISDEITELKSKKEELKKTNENLLIEKGKKEQAKIALDIENQQLETKIENLLSKVDISKTKKKVLNEISQYIDTLNLFIENEKKEKHINLEESILNELNRLMHKSLIKNIKVRLIPDNKGLEVLLFDQHNREILKEDLSKGEQQLYISSLLKAILNESVSDLPVFIDTPLGRLDKQHKENILDNFYPTLANQVVIFSTDEEITESRLQRIRNIVSQTYILTDNNGNAVLTKGYFN